MAGNFPAARGVEVKITWSFNGTPQAINILHFDNPSLAVMTQTIANNVGTAIRTAFTSSALVGQIHTGVTLSKVELRGMSAASNPWFTSTGAAVPGTAVGKPLPAATALVVSLKTGLRGRSYNGRTYIWGWAEGANDTGGGASLAAAAAASKFLDDMKVAIGGGTPALNLAVLSRFTTPPGGTAPVERPEPVVTPVASTPADQRWDVQRRRAVPGV